MCDILPSLSLEKKQIWRDGDTHLDILPILPGRSRSWKTVRCYRTLELECSITWTALAALLTITPPDCDIISCRQHLQGVLYSLYMFTAGLHWPLVVWPTDHRSNTWKLVEIFMVPIGTHQSDCFLEEPKTIYALIWRLDGFQQYWLAIT